MTDGAAIPTAITTLSTLSYFTMSPRTLPDVVRQQKFKMAAMKPEVEISFNRSQNDDAAIPTSNPIFSAMADSDMLILSTSPEIARR